MRVSFCALGCKVNKYEADCYAKLFRDKGYEIASFDEVCDVYVINTCSVTNIGDRKSRQMIRRAKKMNPHAVVAATGCYVQVHKEEVNDMPEVDIVLGTADRHLIVDMVEAVMHGENACEVADIMKERKYEEMEYNGENERTRAYLKIEDGCDNFCSYCIIPYARGAVRSRDPNNIKKEVITLAKKGFLEIVITGISVASYGKDLKENISLIDIIETVSQTEGIKRVRLSSLDPRCFTDDFIKRLSLIDNLCRHFHISLQSGSDSVLNRMNRKYTAEFYLSVLKKIRDIMPDSSITTDIICGFPEETEEEFLATVDFVRKAQFLKVHIFPYSERNGTRAASMPQIDKKVREERAKRLSKVEAEEREKIEKSFIGKRMTVLFEQSENGFCEGLTENYLRVYVKSAVPLDATLHDCLITKWEKGKLFAEL